MKPSPILMAALVVAGHFLFLGSSILGRAAVLRDGQTIILPVEPVDPRDLLRGDYVRLGYAISNVDAQLLAEKPEAGTVLGDMTLRVRVMEGSRVEPIAVFMGSPPTALGAGQLDLVGRSPATWHDGMDRIPVTYGIERYYVPEGEGREIERDLGDEARSFNVHVAVASGGAMQIKSLYDGETRLYEEPLY